MPPFHWSKNLATKFTIPLPFILHLKTPTQKGIRFLPPLGLEFSRFCRYSGIISSLQICSSHDWSCLPFSSLTYNTSKLCFFFNQLNFPGRSVITNYKVKIFDLQEGKHTKQMQGRGEKNKSLQSRCFWMKGKGQLEGQVILRFFL